MRIRHLCFAILSGIGMLAAFWLLVAIAPIAYAQIAVFQLEISPVMRNYYTGEQFCTSVYTVTNESASIANYVHQYYGEPDGVPVHTISTSLPASGTTTYDLTNITALPFGYRGRVVIQSNQPFTATLTACPLLPPIEPSNLIATAISQSQILLSWADNSTNETGFKIERSFNGVNWVQIITVGANVTTYANTGLASGTTYFYRVQAYNSAGNSAYSNTANATTVSPEAEGIIYLPIITKPEPPYQGEWEGTTSQGASIFFNVANNTVTYLEFEINVADCTFSYFNNGLSETISGNTFSVSDQYPDGSFTFNGTFHSNTTASGNLRIADSCGSANVTWNAIKQ